LVAKSAPSPFLDSKQKAKSKVSGIQMSRKRVIKALSSLGLETKDIEVYVFLAIEGPRETQTIAKAMKINQNELGNRLEILKNKGLVMNIDTVVPSRFYAIPFENALDLLVETNLKQAQNTEKNKNAILEDWSIILKNIRKNEVNS
jgi:sugar-specific transcriptional regulator TrmB